MFAKMFIRWTRSPAALLFMPIMTLVMFVFGFIMASVMITTGEETTWFAMGTLMAGIVPLFASPFFFALSYSQEFNLVLSLGSTRREFITGYLLRQAVLLLLTYGLVFALGQLESLLYPLMFPGIVKEAGFTPLELFCDLRLLIPMFAVSLIMPLFFGSLIARFGKVAWLVIYFGFLLLSFNISHILDNQMLIRFVLGVPLSAWYAVGAAVLAAMLTTGLLLSKKQAVQ